MNLRAFHQSDPMSGVVGNDDDASVDGVTDRDFYCLSLYLKTAVVGKNNNLLPLTDIQSSVKKIASI